MRVTVNIDEALRRQAEAIAAEQGVSLSAFVESALRRLLTPPADLPVHYGGEVRLPDGLDINQTSAVLQYLDEMEWREAQQLSPRPEDPLTGP
jgi:hypothetical protein